MEPTSVRLSAPAASLFKLPPSPVPDALSPPNSGFTYAPAFDISPTLYSHLLNVAYPITIAAVYATTVIYVNQVNRQRGHKPWAFSKSSAFFYAVVAHNVFLAAYSGWTFVGMVEAVRHSWPGWRGQGGLAGAADALCKMHGPRGLGQAATYNGMTQTWGLTSHDVTLENGFPDATDVGRLWNEGLAFYGWLFYLSKFYEVVDTAIILAKGKTSSTLQVYHHAGAMMCMWAGIRYMAPPIWMFVLVNSAIHAMMYAYYTLTAISVRVPQAMKRTLTSLQIAQFLVGTSYAISHLFVSYTIPVSVPYNVISSFPSSAVSSATSIAKAAAASGGVANLLKRFALRAAGEEGLAENVPVAKASPSNGFAEVLKEEVRYRTEYQTVPCIDTSGQAFAIWLNVIYLLPLTYLFVNFFITSYTRRSGRSSTAAAVEKAGVDALKGVERTMHEDPLPTAESRAAAKEVAREALAEEEHA
ncbi:MAG: hypothetical protein M1832_003724 [Thelocarpon impressellum]|nr:MAG: hypothetical protein M1832_003724 [Thelocarpon impressellum]